MPRPWTLWRPSLLSLLLLVALAFWGASVAASELAPADPRFAGLERLYFERLDDPAAATSSIRRGGDVSPLDEELRRLLPAVLGEGEGPTVGERVIEPAIGPIGFGLAIRDLPLPEAVVGPDVFLRQVVDGTHPRIHEQFWALYAGGRRTDLWFFSPTPDRTESKLVAPLQVEEIRQPDETSLLLRVSGAMIRPQGAGWLQGVDLHFAADGSELRYRHAVRLYSFTYGYDLGSGSSALVSVEIPRQQDGRTVLEQRLAFDVPPGLAGECGIEPEYDFPSGTFDELAAIATCITSSPGTVTRWRESDEPTFIERGGRPVVEPIARLPEGSLDPPSDAVELCAGHVTGAPLPDSRPGPHITWSLYTSTETRRSLAQRYQEALGDEGHTADPDCDTWKRPPERPGQILEVCELAAEGPWGSCPPPPEKAKTRILVSTMARSN
jgi:hypothetical protein